MAGQAVYRKLSRKVGAKNAKAYLYGKGASLVEVRQGNGDWKSMSIGDAVRLDNFLLSRLKALSPGRERSDTVEKAKSIRAALNHMAGIRT